MTPKNKAQEKEHATTLARIARQEAAEAAKMKCGGKVKASAPKAKPRSK